MLAADVLLARLQGQCVRAPLVVVQGHADEAAGDAPHLRLRHRHEADMRSTERRGDAEGLTVADGDIETALTGRRQQRARMQVGGADGQCAGVVSGLRKWREVLDGSRKARVLHEQGSVVSRQCRAHGSERKDAVAGRDDIDADAPPFAEGAQHRDGFRVHGVHDRDAGATGCLHGDDHRLGCRGCPVVERRVRHVEAGERADHRLELEDRLQGPLRSLGLVGGVRRVELGPRDGAANDGGTEPPVDTGAEKAVVRAQ